MKICFQEKETISREMQVLERKILNQSETAADPIAVLQKIENEIQNLTLAIIRSVKQYNLKTASSLSSADRRYKNRI